MRVPATVNNSPEPVSSSQWYRLPRKASDDVEFQLAFSPSDCHAFVMLPIYDGGKMVSRITERMGEVVLFSISSHRDKFPVSRLGRVLPIGFTAGRRTVAGTIGLVMWDRNSLRRLSERLYRAFPQFIAEPHADELPPLDIALVFVNETGHVVSVTLYGVTILDEGVTLQMDDVRAVVTLSYMAVDYEIDHEPLKGRRDTGTPIANEKARGTPAPNREVRANRYKVNPASAKRGDLNLSLIRPDPEARGQKLSYPPGSLVDADTAAFSQKISSPPEALGMDASQLDLNLFGEFVDRPIISW